MASAVEMAPHDDAFLDSSLDALKSLGDSARDAVEEATRAIMGRDSRVKGTDVKGTDVKGTGVRSGERASGRGKAAARPTRSNSAFDDAPILERSQSTAADLTEVPTADATAGTTAGTTADTKAAFYEESPPQLDSATRAVLDSVEREFQALEVLEAQVEGLLNQAPDAAAEAERESMLAEIDAALEAAEEIAEETAATREAFGAEDGGLLFDETVGPGLGASKRLRPQGASKPVRRFADVSRDLERDLDGIAERRRGGLGVGEGAGDGESRLDAFGRVAADRVADRFTEAFDDMYGVLDLLDDDENLVEGTSPPPEMQGISYEEAAERLHGSALERFPQESAGRLWLLAHTKKPWRGHYVDRKTRSDKRKREAAKRREKLAKQKHAEEI